MPKRIGKWEKSLPGKRTLRKGRWPFSSRCRGVSMLDGEGQPFCDRAADQAMFDAIKQHLRPGIPFVEVDRNINDPEFAAKAVELIIQLIQQAKTANGTHQTTDSETAA